MRPRLTLLLLLARSLLWAPDSAFGLGVEDSLYSQEFQQFFQFSELDLQSEDNPSSKKGPIWSHKPLCTQKLPAPIDSELCVYTNQEFGGGRGFSIFTTPRIAAEIAALPPFQDETLLSTHRVNDFQGNWYTKKIPGKGVGMLAKGDIKRGDVITTYTPVLVAYSENMLSKQERERFLQLAVNQLPTPSGDAYFKLATIYGDPSIQAQDIASANTFGLELGGKGHLAVFPESSRLNHACAPNAQWHINATQLVQRVRAVRPVQSHEELTIAYYNPLDTFAARQKYLSTSFGFTCSCTRCQAGAGADDTLREIEVIQASLGDWTPSSAASVKRAEYLVRLYEQEGLHAYLDVAYAHAALTYSGAGSLRGATKYLELVVEAVELRLGSDAAELEQWREMLRDPTAHWTWMMRRRGK